MYYKVVIFFVVMACASSTVIKTDKKMEKPKMSESSVLKVRRGVLKFLNEMCSGDMIEAEVMKRICIPASKLNLSLKSRCSTCDAYVDPMCALDCPQFFQSNIDLKSRCSTCDSYVDPMCALDCPQFLGLEINLMSRCSTCDAYVDPMCAMDCPQ